MTPKLLDIHEAATFLNIHPETLRRKAASGDIPGAKPGKRWCFRDDDLAEYLRTLYSKSAKASLGVIDIRRKICHSTNVVIRGGLESATMDKEYNEALKLPTK